MGRLSGQKKNATRILTATGFTIMVAMIKTGDSAQTLILMITKGMVDVRKQNPIIKVTLTCSTCNMLTIHFFIQLCCMFLII